jgi:hypothetical protein
LTGISLAEPWFASISTKSILMPAEPVLGVFMDYDICGF